MMGTESFKANLYPHQKEIIARLDSTPMTLVNIDNRHGIGTNMATSSITLNVNNREGFWVSTQEPSLPTPVSQPWKGQSAWLPKLDKVEKKAAKAAYRGFSTCRLCDKMNGSEELSYKGWVWPSGYRHYIQDHSVRPSLAFEEFIAREGAISL